MKASLQDSESRRAALQAQFSQTCSLLQGETQRHSSAQSQWLRDKSELLEKLRLRERTIEEQQAAIADLEGKGRVMTEERVLQRDLESQVGSLQHDRSEARTRESQLRKQLEDLKSDLQAHKDDLDRRSSLYLQDKQRLGEQLAAMTRALEGKTQECMGLQRDLMDAGNSITTLEQLCCDTEDLHQMHEEAVKQCRTYQLAQDLLARELDLLADYLLNSSTSRLQLSQAAQTLSMKMHSKEDEIDQLKEVISKLKKRMVVYVPVKVETRQDDSTDVALAEYLNNRDEALPVPFKREQPEIYTFGSKRIFVKVENGKIASKRLNSPSWRRFYDHRRIYRGLYSN